MLRRKGEPKGWTDYDEGLKVIDDPNVDVWYKVMLLANAPRHLAPTALFKILLIAQEQLAHEKEARRGG